MRTKKFLSLLLSAAMAFSLLTATAFAAAPAAEENGFFDFLLGKKYTYLYAALTWDEYWANEKVYACLLYTSSSASAMTMPMGPTMISALRQFTTTAFSPVAARFAPALCMACAATLLVPTATSRMSGPVSYTHLDVYKRQVRCL